MLGGWDRDYAERVAAQIRRENEDYNCYLEVKVLPDNSIAILMELAYTRAICLGATQDCPFTKRYCFADRDLASRIFKTLQSEDDRLEGWVAKRPEEKLGQV